MQAAYKTDLEKIERATNFLKQISILITRKHMGGSWAVIVTLVYPFIITFEKTEVNVLYCKFCVPNWVQRDWKIIFYSPLYSFFLFYNTTVAKSREPQRQDPLFSLHFWTTTLHEGGWWLNGEGVGLVIRRSPVRFPAVPHDVESLGKAFHSTCLWGMSLYLLLDMTKCNACIGYVAQPNMSVLHSVLWPCKNSYCQMNFI